MMENPKLYIISTDKVFDYPEEYFKAYFPKRYEKSKEYRHESDALRSLCTAILLKDVLGIREKDLLYNKYGKPFSDKCGYSFNISHSGKYCALAVYASDIGVDIELRRKTREKNIKRLLTLEEYSFVQNDPDNKFFDVWTMKESLCKYFGYGMKMRITSINVLPLLESGNTTYDGINLYGKNMTVGDYSLSLCSDNEFETVEINHL